MGWSVHPSIRQVFLEFCRNGDFKRIKHQGTHRIAYLVEIQENSRKIQQYSKKFKKIQQFIGRIVALIELVSHAELRRRKLVGIKVS